jgi:GMP synthase (glutamine-hydrolysing)
MRLLILQHDRDTGLGSLEQPLRERGLELEQWFPHEDPHPPSPLGDYDGVIVLGGVTHPDQDATKPWLTVERDAVRSALADERPVLGVCLGGQILAQAAGATAGPADEAEIGWFEVERLDEGADDALLGGFPERFPAFEWHHYAFELPPGATLLARTGSAHQAFRIGDRAWGLQFHIEADAPIIRGWLQLGGTEAAAAGFDPAAIDEATTANDADYRARARLLADGFADVVERYAARR